MFLEIIVTGSDFYVLQTDNVIIGYAIKNSDGILIEFYIVNK